jgi:hypothetical protein
MLQIPSKTIKTEPANGVTASIASFQPLSATPSAKAQQSNTFASRPPKTPSFSFSMGSSQSAVSIPQVLA